MIRWAAVALAVATSACASTGAVPKPFPMPSPAARSPEAPADSKPRSAGMDGYALVGTALALRGAPYRNGGSDPNGFDCSGFTQYVFAQYGVALPRKVEDQFHEGRPVDVNALAPGDLLFFTTTDPGASHVAIMVGGDQFVHAPSSTGVVRVEHLRSSYWSQRYLGARRLD
jgi:cell wall-associated NlpC family hydrolase